MNSVNRRRAALLLAVPLLVFSPVLLGQSAGTAALTGTVTDVSGAVIPSVTVTAINTDTGLERTAVTGADGLTSSGF